LIEKHGPLDIYPDDWSRTLTLKMKITVPEFHLRMIKQNTSRIANFLLNSNWGILRAQDNAHFVTSDNPLILLENSDWSRRTRLDITDLHCTKFMALTPQCAVLMGGLGSSVKRLYPPIEVVEDLNRSVARNLRRFLFAKQIGSLLKVSELGDEASGTRDGRLSEKQ
jgi:hypothetical protein